MSPLLWLFFIVSSVQDVTSQVSLMESGPGTVKSTKTLEMTCKVTGASLTDSTNMYCLHWIRQTERKQLEWLGTICYTGGTGYRSSVQGRLTLTRDTNKGEVYFKLTEMKTEESATYYCARENSGGYAMDVWGPGTLVTVTSAEKSGPHVFPLVPCCDIISSSTEIVIGCLSKDYLPEPVDVTWNSGSITTGIRNFPGVLTKNGKYMSSSLLTISTSDFKANKYTCNVNHRATSTRINKDIGICEDLPTISPTVELMQASCGETGSVALVCLISGYSPDDIKVQWLLNGKPTSITPNNSEVYKNKEGNLESKSQVSVPKEDWNSGDIYTCRVIHPPSETKNEDSIHNCQVSDSVTSPPKVVLHPPSPKDLLITKEPRLICEVTKLVNIDSLLFKWTRTDGKRIQAFTSDPEEGFDGTYTVKSTLRISIADWQAEKSFVCIVQHSDLHSPVEKTIHKRNEPTTEPSVYIFPPPPEELASYDFVTLTCMLKRYSPKGMYVQWKKNNMVMEEDKYTNTEPILDELADNYYSYSTVFINKSDWNRGAKYTCSGVLGQINSKEITRTRGK